METWYLLMEFTEVSIISQGFARPTRGLPIPFVQRQGFRTSVAASLHQGFAPIPRDKKAGVSDEADPCKDCTVYAASQKNKECRIGKPPVFCSTQRLVMTKLPVRP